MKQILEQYGEIVSDLIGTAALIAILGGMLYGVGKFGNDIVTFLLTAC